ncbi:MAG: Crp/Fnr family transcriptional regulator [Rhodoblastus sp.]|nr:Crp/Fnr family transcriptional regulator [Rhodoblastus sp.]
MPDIVEPDFLAHFDAAGRAQIAERAHGPGERLFLRGDRPKFMFYVASGEARLTRISAAGAEIVFQRASNGFLAEASLDQPAYHCDGVAFTRTRTLAIPIAQFRAALAREDFRDHWLRHLSRELRRSRAHGERLALRTARERIIHYIETEGSAGALQLKQSKKSWAAEMGLTHEALYRTLASMASAGQIVIEGHRLELRKTD